MKCLPSPGPQLIDCLLSFLSGMSFLIRRQEENKNQTVSHNQKPPLWQRGLHRHQGIPPDRERLQPSRPPWGVPVWGCEGESALFREMAVACPAWWEGSWFPGEFVSKRKNNFKEIKKKKKKGKLNWNYNWNILLVANDWTHTYMHLHLHMLARMCAHRKIKLQNFLWNKNIYLGKMGIQMN